MCHLTQTGQTNMREATFYTYAKQVAEVFDHYDTLKQPAERVNYNFMARGEPFANSLMISRFDLVRSTLEDHAAERNLAAQYNISTIMPMEIADVDLAKLLHPADNVAIYYSLYSMQEQFRKRWLPKALDPNIALDKLAEYQQKTGGEVALHWAFMKDQNDDIETLVDIVEAVRSRGLKAKFNLVRYNPYSIAQGEESPDNILQRNFYFMRLALGDKLGRIVPRVGHDVKASCGMFVEA